MGNGKVSLTLSFVVLCKNWIQNGFSTFFLFFDQNMQDVFLCIHAYCTKGCYNIYLELSQLCHWTDPLAQEIYAVEEEKISKICCSKQYPLSSLQLKGSRSLCWHKKRKNINLKIHFLIAKRPVPAEWTAVKFCWSHRYTSIAAGKCLLNFSSALIAVLQFPPIPSGTLPVLGTKVEEMNDLQSCFVNGQNRPAQLVSRFDAQSNYVSKIILDITSIVVLMNLEVVVDVVVAVRSVIRNENPTCSNMCTQMREIKLAL